VPTGGVSAPERPEQQLEIEVRYFAMFREVVGRSREVRDLPLDATADDLFDALIREHPRLERMRPITMIMVNQEYVAAEQRLQPGDEVAFIPPVSGGEGRFRVQVEPIDPRQVEALVADPGAGAIVTFIGVVRDNARGQAVTHLEYEAYAPAAERMLAQIGDEIAGRWGIGQVAISHRIGSLRIGEMSVAISVSSPHRDAAFEACRYAIERIKEIVPIWKKEHYANGAVWIGSEHDYQTETGRLPAQEAT
jgi:molybdopterin converting factor subunit 1